jgi:tripartite-type tricarboxylate transporter receptor subunit TctC
MLLAQEVGVEPADVNYVAYDGGGELLAGILGGDVQFAATGVGEVTESAEAGDVRILAVTSEEPVEGVDAPTLQDEGVDLTFTNWRGIVAAPDITDEQRQKFIDAVTAMHDSDAWKKDPGGLPVGGASNPGGPDHLTPMLLAEEVGVDPTTVNYVPYDGGGELLAGILGKKLAFAATGVSEVAEQAAAGELKILAVTSEEPVEGVDAPTLQDEGIDLTFTNWRGIVAAPDISDADRTKLTDLVTEMHGSAEWQQALEDNGWTDAFMSGDEFESFLTSESERVQGVLTGLGLA